MGFEWRSIELSLNDFHVADLSRFNIPYLFLVSTNWRFVSVQTVPEISQ